MTIPTTFPVWLSKPGEPDTFVTDINGFNAAIARGCTYGTVTPTKAVAAPTGAASLVEPQVSAGQPHAVFDAIAHGTRR